MSILNRSVFKTARLIPPDAIFDLTKRYVADKHQSKVNLGQGTYRDENGLPWVLPSVRMAERAIKDPGHEYLPIAGLQSFRDEAVNLVLHDTGLIETNQIASCQALSGTGALLLAGLTLKKGQTGIDTIYLTEPTWSNHQLLFESMNYKIKKLPYYLNGAFDFESYMNELEGAGRRSAVIFHACAHNPTGCDPSKDQWRQIAKTVKRNGIFPIFDAAYLGFSSGSVDEDAWSIKEFVREQGLEAAICLSFAKSMGLYGERVGLTIFVTASSDTQRTVNSILENVQRSTISNPPAYGARIASTVLSNAKIREQWFEDLVTMSGRISSMRQKLHDELLRLQTPGDWSMILTQRGMFGYTGLIPAQVNQLEKQYHIYMARTSRISIAGLNDNNVTYVAKAINAVVRDSMQQGSMEFTARI